MVHRVPSAEKLHLPQRDTILSYIMSDFVIFLTHEECTARTSSDFVLPACIREAFLIDSRNCGIDFPVCNFYAP